MTAIAGVVADGRVCIGGDSAGVSGYDLVVRADPKVFRTGAFLVGYTSSFRMGQLLRYGLGDLTAPRDPLDPMDFMVTGFIPFVRDLLAKGGFRRKENEVESGGEFLVGWRGHLYSIASDFQVGEALAGYDAVGCGASVALGALYMTSAGWTPEERVTAALSAAEAHNAGVRGPFTVLAL